MFVGLSVFVGGTHCGFQSLAEYTCSNQPPVPDELIIRPVLTVVAKVPSLLDC